MAILKSLSASPKNKHDVQAIRSITSKAIAPTLILSRDVFLQMLRVERRRTERSGRKFMLLLISSDDFGHTSKEVFSQSVASTVANSTRETDIIGWYEVGKTLGILATEIDHPDGVAIVTILQKVRRALQHSMTLERYERLNLSYQILPPAEGEQAKGRSGISNYPWTSVNDREKWSRMLKRSVDIAGSCTALILLSPILPLIAALVKVSSKGPVLFCQKRVGQHGREFMFYKFRTMYVNNDPRIHEDYIAKLISGEMEAQKSGGLFKIVNDPRVTRFGSFLRRTSLDELPQFINVLLNDMSLVGPRPPLPYEFGRYQAWHRRRVLELKPGLTGLWQVQGRSTTTFDEMVRMDLRYARNRSFWVDLRILCQTPGVMLSGRGAC